MTMTLYKADARAFLTGPYVTRDEAIDAVLMPAISMLRRARFRDLRETWGMIPHHLHGAVLKAVIARYLLDDETVGYLVSLFGIEAMVATFGDEAGAMLDRFKY